MIKKRAVMVLGLAIILLLSINFILAANDSTTTTTPTKTTSLAGFDKGYTCLKDIINAKSLSSLTNEELAFSILAMGYDSGMQSKLKTEFDSRKDTTAECWPKGACTLKETSLALLVYNHLNANSNKIKDWPIPATDLIWYLQVDTSQRASCKITYDGTTKTVIVGDDKKITGSAGACFALSSNGYWLEVKNNCYEKEFKVSCDQAFLTSLLYKGRSTTNPAYYVSALTHTGDVNSETSEKVSSLCFKQSGVCNYEGSLWAAIAVVQKDSKFRDKVLPYLMTLASTNDRAFPSSFLYSLTNYDEYLTEMNNKQNAKGYWQISDASKKYYDTATAILSLYGRSSEQSQKAVEYLLDPSVQSKEGCWNGNNIRDTAFILYSAAPKQASSSGGSVSKCADFSDYSCVTSKQCEDINGSILGNFYCAGLSQCCSKKKPLQTCDQLGGKKCAFGDECSGGTMEEALSTTSCCVGGKCTEKEETYTCVGTSYTCRTECATGEEEDESSTCAENGKCCTTAITPESKSYWWVWLLVILIILLALAIVYRNQLKIWIFKMKSKFSKNPPAPNQQRPQFPPSMPPQQGMMPRRIMPNMQQPQMRPGLQRAPPVPGKPYPRDKELSETLDKLKRMGR